MVSYGTPSLSTPLGIDNGNSFFEKTESGLSVDIASNKSPEYPLTGAFDPRRLEAVDETVDDVELELETSDWLEVKEPDEAALDITVLDPFDKIDVVTTEELDELDPFVAACEELGIALETILDDPIVDDVL